MDPKVLINYYVRKGWSHHIQKLCENVLDKRGIDTSLVFWRAFAIGMEGSFAEAIRELENLKSKRDVEYACIAALIYMHKKCKLVDHEEVAQLEMLQLSAEDRAGDAALLLVRTVSHGYTAFIHSFTPCIVCKHVLAYWKGKGRTSTAGQNRRNCIGPANADGSQSHHFARLD